MSVADSGDHSARPPWRPASTYPELMDETASWPLDARRRLAAAYELAEAMATGIERAHGQSLTAHLVRTASICATHGADRDVVVAALVHAAYLLDRFDVDDGARPRRSLTPTEVEAAVGADVERLVSIYVDTMPFDRIIDDHLASAPDWTDDRRRAGLIHLANTLDDHLGGAARWAGADGVLTPAHGELARLLGAPALGGQLDLALEHHRSSEVPDELRRPHRRGYVARSISEA